MATNFLKRYFLNGKAVKWWVPLKDQKQRDVVRLSDPKGKIILDAGAGKGRFSDDFLNEECKFVLALDISKEMIRITKKRLKNRDDKRVSFVIADIEYIPLKDSFFDVALCVDTLVHLSNPERGLCELTRTIKDDGKVVVDVTSPISIQHVRDLPCKPIDTFFYLTIEVKRLIHRFAGPEVFWKFYRIFLSPFMTPWLNYSREEFYHFIENANLRPVTSIEYKIPHSPSIYFLSVCEKKKMALI